MTQRSRFRSLITGTLLLLLFVTIIHSVTSKTLVLLDKLESKLKYSNFFSALTKRRHELEFKSATDDSNALEMYGETTYENVIIFAPEVEDFGGFEVSDLEYFANKHGGNVLIGLNKNTGHAMRQFIKRMGVNLPKKGVEVVDHFSYQDHVIKSGENEVEPTKLHTVVYGGKLISNEVIVNEKIVRRHGRFRKNETKVFASTFLPPNILFEGVNLVHKKSSLAFPIMRAKRTAYAADLTKKIESMESQNTGKRMVLISGLQARNNARVVISGSVAMFENMYSENNLEFIDSITEWNFRETGTIRINSSNHKLHNGNHPQCINGDSGEGVVKAEIAPYNPSYLVNQHIEYSLVVEEYVQHDSSWVPFVKGDLQLELVMIEPILRLNLTHNGSGRYNTIFQLPNHFGIYKLRFIYDRSPSFTRIETIDVITVRPKNMKEDVTYTAISYPYFIAVAVLQIGWMAFGAKFFSFKNLYD